MIGRAASVALVVMAACGPESPAHDAFVVDYTLNTDGLNQRCSEETCDAYAMSCDAIMLLRIVEAARGGRILTEDCVLVSGADLCSLAEVDLDLDAIPASDVRVQVAVWRADDIPEGRCPNGEIFDLSGMPISTFFPQPAFGGETYHRAGAEPAVVVELGCTNPGLLDVPECRSSTEVIATISDITAVNYLPDPIARNLLVYVGEPAVVLDEDDRQVGVLETSDATQLTPVTGNTEPLWEGVVAGGLRDRACIQVVDPEGTGATTVACQQTVLSGNVARPEGLFLPREKLDQILEAMGLGAVPARGLVVGRVVDHLGLGAPGVQISGQSATVEYLSIDGTSVSTQGTTAPEGYFVSRNAPYDTRWDADQSGVEEAGDFRAGLIQGKVSTVLIQLEAPTVGSAN